MKTGSKKSKSGSRRARHQIESEGENIVESISRLSDEELLVYQNGLRSRMMEPGEKNPKNVYRSAEYRNYRLRRHLQIAHDEQQKRKASD